jgi:hypothetical protein
VQLIQHHAKGLGSDGFTLAQEIKQHPGLTRT